MIHMEKKPGMTPQKAAEVFPENNTKPLKQLRLRRGFSQHELATATDISVRLIQSYEQGQRDINGASLSTLCDLSEALECRIGDIIDDEQLKEKYNRVK